MVDMKALLDRLIPNDAEMAMYTEGAHHLFAKD
jgi:hypothetical protein